MSEEDETKIKAAATRHGVQVQASPRAAAGTAAQSGQSKWRWLGPLPIVVLERLTGVAGAT